MLRTPCREAMRREIHGGDMADRRCCHCGNLGGDAERHTRSHLPAAVVQRINYIPRQSYNAGYNISGRPRIRRTSSKADSMPCISTNCAVYHARHMSSGNGNRATTSRNTLEISWDRQRIAGTSGWRALTAARQARSSV